MVYRRRKRPRFNTQPPEGGWLDIYIITQMPTRFNTQPPEGGWAKVWERPKTVRLFQHTAA